MKKIGVIASLLLMGNVLFAQSIQEGKQFLNYERYQSAEDVFQKLLAANPNNTEAAYWLGQTYLDPNREPIEDRKSTRLNSSHPSISYAVFCLKKKKNI